MTVGIGAICEANSDEPKVVVAADRLVTSGRAARREYEHTSSKMLDVFGTDGNEPCVAVGVGAGSVSLIDEVFFKLGGKVAADSPTQTRDIAENAVSSLQEVVQETIDRQVLNAFGLDLQSFNQIQGQMNQGVVQGLYQDIIQKKEETLGQVNVLLAGIDADGAHLYNILNNDMARNDSIGYLAVGSGAEPANSTFIRNRYDDTCDLSASLLSVTEAKAQAEEAQGVGREMDIVILDDNNGCRYLEEDEVSELRDIYDDVVDTQLKARKDTVDESDYSFEI